MPARSLSQAQIDAIAANGRELLRKERQEKAPKQINVGNALALGQPIPLLWDGVEHLLKPISYREGLRLQGTLLELKRWGEKPAQTPEEVAEQDRFMAETLELLGSLLSPRPSANPFADATPWEVGELVAFFTECLTKQRGQSRLGAPPPSTMH